MSFTKNLQHIIFATKYRQPVLNSELRPPLYQAMGQMIKRLNCYPIIINGIEDHVHIICGVHPTVSISDLVKRVKQSSTRFLFDKYSQYKFEGWQRGYASFSFHRNLLDIQYNYVLTQRTYHEKTGAGIELINILNENDIEYNVDFLE